MRRIRGVGVRGLRFGAAEAWGGMGGVEFFGSFGFAQDRLFARALRMTLRNLIKAAIAMTTGNPAKVALTTPANKGVRRGPRFARCPHIRDKTAYIWGTRCMGAADGMG